MAAALWTPLLGQAPNDECQSALPIPDVTDWCSAVGAYSNEGATPSGFGQASCWESTSNDVWFVFTPIATDVSITVIGDTDQGSGGTLQRPEVALYTGNCQGIITELRCDENINSNIVELYKGGLQVGVPHFIRIQGENGATGTFELCINNFNPPVQPGSDCVIASVLCNKETFTVDDVVGPGNEPDEAGNSSCLGAISMGNSESNSTWFTWTAATSGTLTFTLSPTNPLDDLDFVLYELPDGILNCGNKQELRCMASGDFDFPSPCMGPTGLAEGETDLSESSGCSDPAQNNFLAPINMVAGRSYALLVNNFTSTGNGFTLEFGGTGTFAGPIADFTADDPDLTVCVGDPITFSDLSTYPLGDISGWEWSFGPGADQPVADSRGPHTIAYNTAGTKSVVLTIETQEGCRVTEIKTVEIACCADHFDLSANVTDNACPNEITGAIDLSVSNPYGPYTFNWSSGQTNEDLSGLPADQYDVLIADQAGCDTTLNFEVTAPDPYEVDTLITRPDCGGGTNGTITLGVSGGSPGYEFNWQNSGFGPDSTLTGLAQGVYPVVVRDQAGCTFNLAIPLRELTLALNPLVTAITPPSCFGFSDGFIVVSMENGTPEYQFNFNDGNGFTTDSVLQNLSSGVYNVRVEDAEDCIGNFTFELQDPPPLANTMTEVDVSCFGDSDGSATAGAIGGVGGYTFSWDAGGSTPQLQNLPAGAYPLLIRDANGCAFRDTARIGQPPPLFTDLVSVRDARCFGEGSGEVEVGGTGGVPPYTYSIDSLRFQPDPLLTGLTSGDYTLYVQDANGCLNDTSFFIDQPPPLLADAGEDEQIELGFSTPLQATASADSVSFSWAPFDSLSCANCPDPVADPTRTTSYTVTVRDSLGCTDADSLTVFVLINRPVYIPNAFSPNDDGRNDFFTVYGGIAAQNIESLRVYSRWGELVFEGRDLLPGSEPDGWDGTHRGKALNNGVYIYVAEVRFVDQSVVVFEGEVTLLR
jgi:gliding motility-associated-like protein